MEQTWSPAPLRKQHKTKEHKQKQKQTKTQQNKKKTTQNKKKQKNKQKTTTTNKKSNLHSIQIVNLPESWPVVNDAIKQFEERPQNKCHTRTEYIRHTTAQKTNDTSTLWGSTRATDFGAGSVHACP